MSSFLPLDNHHKHTREGVTISPPHPTPIPFVVGGIQVLLLSSVLSGTTNLRLQRQPSASFESPHPGPSVLMANLHLILPNHSEAPGHFIPPGLHRIDPTDRHYAGRDRCSLMHMCVAYV